MISSAFFKRKSPNHYIKCTLLSVLSGTLAGIAATVFLVLLHHATEIREQNRALIYLLPLGGLLVGWIYHHYGQGAERGSNLILDEIHEPKNTVPVRMAPFVLFGTIVTHLFGGSAGREGTAVQMGATLSDQLSKFFPLEPEERRILLAAGAGAGFGAAIGAPWAGVIFGMEVIHVGRLRLFAIVECLIASHVGFFVTKLLRAPHTLYPEVSIPSLGVGSIFSSLLAGLAFGLVAVLFIGVTHLVEHAQKRFISYPPLRPLIGGLVLVPLFFLEGSFRFTGLGLHVIQEALQTPVSFGVPLWKIIFTAITLGSAFKGGEFIPLVFIGTTLGSAFSSLLPGNHEYLGALGFAAVFGAASNTPISCTLMAVEIFGAKIGLYAALACFAAYHASFHHTIYSSQKIHKTKFERLKEVISLFGELPRRFLNGGNKE